LEIVLSVLLRGKKIRITLSDQKIDENNDGGVSFDEWLAFALSTYKTICAASLPKVNRNS
jgi:hypothetical protein